MEASEKIDTDEVKCPACDSPMAFRIDEWVCPNCGNNMMDHGDHPDRPEFTAEGRPT